jgi:hypothetical protein
LAFIALSGCPNSFGNKKISVANIISVIKKAKISFITKAGAKEIVGTFSTPVGLFEPTLCKAAK